MRAVRLPDTGDIDDLTLDDVPRPEPNADELLVRVHAAGVNPLDWLVCRGIVPDGLFEEPLPWTPGWDASGVVAAVGSAVTDFDPGDAVCGMPRVHRGGGTFAEYVRLTPADVTPKPAGLSHAEAAGLPMAGQTAFHALYGAAEVAAGQRVLVHAAAGGVGHYAVQLAANTGAHVIGTASGRNEAYLRQLGVDEFVDYREQRFETVLDGVDVVLDAVGGDVLDRSVEVTDPGGVVVTLPEPPSEAAVERYRDQHGVHVRFFDVVLDSDPETLRQVAARAETGAVEPTITDTYPLAAVGDALARSAEGHVRGKLVLDVAADAGGV